MNASRNSSPNAPVEKPAEGVVHVPARYSVVLEVANFGMLRESFGEVFAQALEAEVRERLELEFEVADNACPQAYVLANGCGLYLVSLSADHPRAYCDVQQVSVFLDELLHTLAHGARRAGEDAEHDTGAGLGLGALAVFSAKWRDLRSGAPVGSAAHLEALRIPASQPALDLRMAEEMMHALEQERVHLQWGGVYAFADHAATPSQAHTQARAPQPSGALLYVQCVPQLERCPESDCASLSFGSFMPSLERTRLTRSLDTYVLQRLLQDLREEPALSLGYPVAVGSIPAADGAQDNADWEAIFEALAADPATAARLVIEIAESATLTAHTGRSFINRLQALGCRIALTGYGVRYGAQAHIAITHPDMIKLDRALLARAQHDAKTAARVDGLIALAQQMAPAVAMDAFYLNRAPAHDATRRSQAGH